MVGLLFRAGAPLMAGSDAMNPFCFPGFSLHHEWRCWLRPASPRCPRCRASTPNPSVFLGRSDIGTTAPGKRADLVLLDADPLADIHNTTHIRAARLRGEYFNHAALDQILENAKHGKGGRGE